MVIMMLLPVIIGSLAAMVASWTGFIEAAFMDMTLTLEDFDYGFGPGECNGQWIECGNATFESYQNARLLAFALFIIALVVVAAKDMLKGAFGAEMSLGEADTRNFPAMLKYSVLVFVLLVIFPPVWDASAGIMNNVGIWILNPHYDIAGKGQYSHGTVGHGSMCVGDITYDDMVALAPFARELDRWAVYSHGSGPMDNDVYTSYNNADNYIVPRGGTISRACLHDINDVSCPWNGNSGVPKPAPAAGYQIGDVLCNPDYKVKYVFRQALGLTEMTTVATPEQILGSVSGTGGDDIMVDILTHFIKSSVTIQVIMVVFMTGVMVDVVTAFALAIIPVVMFYRFLPMSDKVRLGDYSAAAFALLAMPLVASLVVVAGAGAVSTMAADEGEAFESFFTWLAALSVVLLVIGIPATMVPLIGAGVQQATAAVQTGVQTAQFAGTALVATAGGAIRGMRGHSEFGRLASMPSVDMTSMQRTRMGQLKRQGFGDMSRAHAAIQGGMGGMRGKMYGPDGRPTASFRDAVMPGTGEITQASVHGLMGGAGMDDQTSRMAGLAGGVTGAATGMTSAIKDEVRAGRAPDQKEMLAEAQRQKAEAVQIHNEATEEHMQATKAMQNSLAKYKGADKYQRYNELIAGEHINVGVAGEKHSEISTKIRGLGATIARMETDIETLNKKKDLSMADRKAIKTMEGQLRRDIRRRIRLNNEESKWNNEQTKANDMIKEYKTQISAELDRLVSSDDTSPEVRDAIKSHYTTKKDTDATDISQEQAKNNYDSISRSIYDLKIIR